MPSYASLLVIVLQVFGIMALGAVVRRLGWLSAQADQSIIRLIINFFLPCLFLDKLLGNPALLTAKGLLLAPAVGAATTLLGFGVASLFAQRLAKGDPVKARTFTFTTGMYNYGYVPIPIVMALFDDAALSQLILLMIGVEVTLWTVGLLVLTGSYGRDAWKRAINAPFISVVVAVLLTRSGAYAYVPELATGIIANLAPCAIPLSILMIGASVIDLLGPRLRVREPLMLAAANLLRLGVLPLCFLATAWALPLPTELKQVLVIEAAMPSAVFPIVLARHYGGDTSTALGIVLSTALISLATMPLWILFGLRMLGYT